VGGLAKEVVRDKFRVTGKLDSHEFDVALANGRPMLAAHALSFEVPPSKELEKAIHATAWAVEDIRADRPELSLAVIVLPPKEKSVLFDRAMHTFDALGAELVREDQLDRWCEHAAEIAVEYLK
jgi:hypothetical protein